MGSNPASGSNENGRWDDPPTEGGPIVLTGREWKTSKKIAEPRLYKKQKKQRKNKLSGYHGLPVFSLPRTNLPDFFYPSYITDLDQPWQPSW